MEYEEIMHETPYRFGQRGEDVAAHYLQSRGYCIWEGRFRTRDGDVDLIAHCPEQNMEKHSGRLLFVEVKARTSYSFGSGADAVHSFKLIRMARVAAAYMERIQWKGDFQLDVVELQFSHGGELLNLNHFQDVMD